MNTLEQALKKSYPEIRKIYTSKGIKEKLDLRVLINITEIITGEEMKDYLQVFSVEKNRLIRKDEFGQQEYQLKYDSKSTGTVWAIQDKCNEKNYWIILFPEEY